jgi:hypothetical protein
MWTEIHVAVTMLAHEFWDLAQLITREEVVTPNADLFFGADTKKLAALLCPKLDYQPAGMALSDRRYLLMFITHRVFPYDHLTEHRRFAGLSILVTCCPGA